MKRLSIIGSLYLAFLSVTVSPFAAPLPASPQGPVAPATNGLQAPVETTFLASLISPIAMAQVKAGDRLEALTTQDIKQGHDVLLKKGAMLLGQVDSVELATAADPAATIKNVVIASFFRCLKQQL